MAWASSTRRQRLPKDWPKRVAEAKRRARGKCQAQEHHPDCAGMGQECDHRVPGDDHSQSNLQWLSAACHKDKTTRENAEANRRRARMRRRPPEQHPGALR